MKFCTNCGAEVHENAAICVKCGCPIQQEKKVDDSVSVGLVILALVIPLFGFIYWPTKSKELPNCARACGIAAIISMVLNFMILMSA